MRKTLKQMGVADHLTSLLRNLYAVQKQELEPHMEQLTDSKLGKMQDKAIDGHPEYLTYMWSTSCEIMDLMNHKLES